MTRYLLTAVAAVLATQPVLASDADVLREARDRAEITRLMWSYARAIDRFDADAYAAVFTPDGAFGKTKGREALRKMVNDLKAGRAQREAKGEKQVQLHHMEGNEYIEFVTPDHARVHYYWLTVFGDPVLTPPPRVAAAGNGMDDVVRVDGHWLIQDRQVVAAE